MAVRPAVLVGLVTGHFLLVALAVLNNVLTQSRPPHDLQRLPFKQKQVRQDPFKQGAHPNFPSSNSPF